MFSGSKILHLISGKSTKYQVEYQTSKSFELSSFDSFEILRERS